MEGYQNLMKQRLPVSTRFLYLVVLWCIFSFKVFVRRFGEAGLRVDDLLLAVAIVVLLCHGDIMRIPRSAAFRAYLTFVSISLCSAAWNAVADRVAFGYSMLFVARLLEYMVFYYLGYVLLESGVRVWRGLQTYFYIIFVVVLLQITYLLPTANEFSVSRASGNTGGPYELAVVAAFYLCYFAYRKRRMLRAAGALVLLLLTASRITFIGMVIVFVMRFFSRSRSKVQAGAIILASVLAAGAGAMLMSPGGGDDTDAETLGSRLNSASTLLSADYRAAYAAVPAYTTSEDYMNGMFLDAIGSASESESDVSGMVRSFRWSALIKSTLVHFDSILIGMGPSFGSAAVDGYFVRVFIETGLAGLVAFVIFLHRLTKRRGDKTGAFREFVMILIVTACFIDIFASYKTMLLLWLWHGMEEFEFASKRERRKPADYSRRQAGGLVLRMRIEQEIGCPKSRF
jgi:hypothetical protein